MEYKLIEEFFDDLADYMRFFIQLKEARKATSDFSCVAYLTKEDDRYLYALEWQNNQFICEYLKPFRPTEENLKLFHKGCAEMARRLRIFLETGDEKQVPVEPPIFGILSCESPDDPELLQSERNQSMADRKYFPVVKDARPVKRYQSETYEVVLLTDVKCSGIIRCSHLLIAFKKGEKEPAYVIAAEDNNLGSPGDGSHFLGCYPGSGHLNYGCSDKWGDLTLFEKKACEIMSSELGIRMKAVVD